MKRFASAILLLVYFTVSTGFTVNLHYCMNKFHSWDIGNTQKEKCGQCGMSVKKASGCCHNEVKVVKLQQELSSAVSLSFQLAAPAIQPSEFITYDALLVMPERSYHSSLAHGPPLLSRQDTYLRNRVFRL